MNSKLVLALGAIAAASWAGPAPAQERARVFQSEPGRAFAYSFSEGDENRAVIGITTGSSGSARDTLGVLISSVTARGPAERAGLEEGNRIAAINGVNLKLAAADVGDWDMASTMSRRLTRELGKVKAGDEVELRVYGSGQVRTVRVKTVTYDSLYASTRRTVTRRSDEDEDRAALGVGLGSSGSKRDTLGVLVSWLDDNGPAAKAGLEEGNRIAAIGSVDLRVTRDDAGDEMIGSVKAQRLYRELEKLKPGDEVDLRVYSDGRFRTVKVKTVAASSLSRGGRGFFFTTPRAVPMPAIPPMPAMPARIMRITL